MSRAGVNEVQDRHGPLRQDILIVALILLLSLAIRAVFFRGIFAIDDFNYLRHAAEVWRGRFDLNDVLFWHGTRPLIFMPISLIFALFGVSEITAVLWPLLASLVTISVVYTVGRTILGRETGAYAAVLAALLPVLIDEATRVTPGSIINFVTALSLLCFVHSETDGRKRIFWLLASGLIFGMMPWAGRLGLAFACFYPLWILIFRKHRFFSYWPAAAGFFLMVSVNILHQWIETGNPLFSNDIASRILANEVPSIKPLFYIKVMAQPLYRQGGIPFIACIGLAAAMIRRHREALFLAVWITATWLIMEFGSSSITDYRPIFKEARFLSVMAIPLVLLSGYALSELRRAAAGIGNLAKVTARGSVIVIGIFLLVSASSYLSLKRVDGWKGESRARLHAVRDHIRKVQGGTIYVTHWLWNTRVGFYTGYDPEYFPSGYDPYHAVLLEKADSDSKNRYVQTLVSGEEMAPGLLLHDEHLFGLRRESHSTGLHGEGEIPGILADPPVYWRLVDAVEMGGGNRMLIYEIDGGVWPAEEGR